MQHAPRILSIDTSDQVLGVDVSVRGGQLGGRVIDEPRVHASLLVPTILEVVAASELLIEDIDAVAVAKGPGSYTGLRIGASAAKGIAYALGIPLIGVPTMQALATSHAAHGLKGALVTCLSSRRNEVYAQIWDLGDELLPLTDIDSISLDLAASFLSVSGCDDFVVAGSGSDKLIGSTASSEGLKVRRSDPGLGTSTVHGVAMLAADHFEQGMFVDAATFEPYYLKDFVAKKGGSPFTAARNR